MKTKEKARHTTVPWKIKTEDHLDGASIYSNEVYITSLEGSENLHQQKLGFLPVDEQKANAAFIVRACNNHDALLKVAKKVVEQLDRATSTPFMDVDVNGLREAIAQAEGPFAGEPIFKSHGEGK